MTRSKTQKWFGVKTVFRTRAVGAPKIMTAEFDPNATLVEERVVIIRARSFAEALSAAEREAQKYAKGIYRRNPYGQPLVTKYLNVSDAYEMFDTPGPMAEVFSITWLVPRSVKDPEIVAARFSPVETKTQIRSRNKFGDALFFRVKKASG